MTNSIHSNNTYRNISSTPLAGDSSQLRGFFIDAIRDIYWAEKHLVKALPKMNAAATTVELRDASHDHWGATQIHIARLQEILQLLQTIPGGEKSEAMAGIVNQCDEMILDTADGTVTRDAGIILVTQKAAHYQIASYGGLTQLADTLSLNQVASILNQTLQEEKTTDESLALIAEDHIHAEIAMETS